MFIPSYFFYIFYSGKTKFYKGVDRLLALGALFPPETVHEEKNMQPNWHFPQTNLGRMYHSSCPAKELANRSEKYLLSTLVAKESTDSLY